MQEKVQIKLKQLILNEFDFIYFMNKYLVFIISVFVFSCSTAENVAKIEYGQVCTVANNNKTVSVDGFLNVADKVPCMNMLNPKRDCAFKLMDKVNITGNEIIVYLQEGNGNNQVDTPDSGKEKLSLKPTQVFTRDEVKFRLNDGTLITPQADIATLVTATGKVNFNESDKLCSIMLTKVEKR